MGQTVGMWRFARTVLMMPALLAAVACYRPSEAEMAESERQDSLRDARERRSRTTATRTVTFDADDPTHYARVEQLIEGRFAGVHVVRTRSGYTIRIRGTRSFATGDNNPLLVVDGVAQSDPDLSGIDPKDIARINILKDGAAAIYGSRGANGVIEIRTRRGSGQ